MTGPDTTQPEQEIARNEPLRDEASEAAWLLVKRDMNDPTLWPQKGTTDA